MAGGEDQTISVFKLGIALILGGIAIRYIFFSQRNSNSNSAPTSASGIRAREADIETIQSMFPQVSRRNIMWDLQRNGGSVAATTERILSGRGLDNPPQTFQPPLPPANSSTLGVTTAPAATRAAPPDLITRYNLADKIANQDKDFETISVTPVGKQAWSQNKGERQALLQKRREDMILAARKKMEAKVAAEAAQKSAPANA